MTTGKTAGKAFRETQGKILTLQTLPMHSDTITGDYISAGWMLSEMDKASGRRAHQYIGGRAVTVGVDAMSFHKSVFVGDLVQIYTEVVRQGRSSLTVKVESWAERYQDGSVDKVTEGLFTFVAIDENHRPIEITTNRNEQNPILVPPGAGASKRLPQAHLTPPPVPPTLKESPERKDTNYLGDIFGGWILAKMDQACALTAEKLTGHEVATVGIESMTFYKPVMVDDEVKFYTEVIKTGNTSVRVKIETWASRKGGGQDEKVTEGIFTYVALDQSRQPVTIAPRL